MAFNCDIGSVVVIDDTGFFRVVSSSSKRNNPCGIALSRPPPTAALALFEKEGKWLIVGFLSVPFGTGGESQQRLSLSRTQEEDCDVWFRTENWKA